jgi:hypothetical protein
MLSTGETTTCLLKTSSNPNACVYLLVNFIKNAGHGFVGFEAELSKLVGNWIGKH